MNTWTRMSFGPLSKALFAPAWAQQTDRRPGDHPAHRRTR
jgi:hypothetical protein